MHSYDAAGVSCRCEVPFQRVTEMKDSEMDLSKACSGPVLSAVRMRLKADAEKRSKQLTRRPFVTLTFAQSLDGSIAGHPGNARAVFLWPLLALAS